MARFLFLFTLIIATNCFAQPGFGDAHKINNGWQFTLNSTDSVAEKPAQSASWQTVDLPHDWSVRQKLDPKNASSMGYLPGGIGWYKKDVVIPTSDKKVYLYFEGVYNRSEVLVNGQSVGKRPNGYISFMYDITPFIKAGKTNEILVKADHHRDADSRWYTGSGIYRDVWLVYANPVHIAQWGVYAYPQVADASAVLNIETAIENKDAKEQQLTVVQELVGPDKKVVGQSSTSVTVAANSLGKAVAAIKVTNPQLWSLNNPTLYTLRTKVLQAGKQIDASVTTTGFRKLSFDANKGFALNDKWMKVKGVCLHHDAGVLGAAMYKEVWRRRLLNLKEVGVNAIRTSHNPQATALYELCDELGLLVMDEAFDEWEFPKRKWLEGWNAGTPGYQGNYDFFPEWGEKDLADMVRRDRNHISIFAWSIGNEVDYPNDPYSHPVLDGGAQTGFTQKIFGGYKKDAPDAMRLGVIAKKLAAVVKQYDRSRPVTAGLAGVAMSNETEYPSALDIAGYNYTENRYTSDHKKYPNRVIFGSENRHDLSAWKAVTDNEHIFGQFLWTGIDYLGESGRWPSRGFYSGLLDFGGFIKPRGFFRQSLWAENPMAYIGTYLVKGGNSSQDVLSQSEGKKDEYLSMDAWASWNYKEGQTVRVVCYTNTAKARLLLDNKEVGAIKEYDGKTGIIYWDIPFKPGNLKVEGLNAAGKEVTAYAVATAGEPAALQIINESKKDDQIKQVAVQMVDAKGNPVYTTNVDVTCSVSGGTLLGLEAGDNSDMGDYTDNVQKTFRGRLLAYVKKNQKPGPVKIVFTAPGLKSVTVTL
ncbi:glycoside hydrolase family 2 TIM barrel-domain containing protein [Niabella yanshanensis]|uniref:Glycoside hydrolase family 2 TIM barrel-domain containing protein n=3 Tax=Niabella yanshanensis TaxID=577386 RepID=A0ABZ0W0Q8_9BACT|nr:glycoside hydrolase family 2 TIM barrel-domain containing protein [Niabella yanshanensis]